MLHLRSFLLHLALHFTILPFFLFVRIVFLKMLYAQLWDLPYKKNVYQFQKYEYNLFTYGFASNRFHTTRQTKQETVLSDKIQKFKPRNVSRGAETFCYTVYMSGQSDSRLVSMANRTAEKMFLTRNKVKLFMSPGLLHSKISYFIKWRKHHFLRKYSSIKHV